MTDAGTWWLKAAWLELGLGAAFRSVTERACRRYRTRTQAPPLRILTHSRAVLVRKTETRAFLPLFENMTRPRHLDSYDEDGLSRLTQTAHTYRAVTIERYLSDLNHLRIAASLGQALARCYRRAWYQSGDISDAHVFYVDMHDKVIWTNQPSPVGFVSALHEVRACLKQTVVQGRGWAGPLLPHLSRRCRPERSARGGRRGARTGPRTPCHSSRGHGPRRTVP